MMNSLKKRYPIITKSKIVLLFLILLFCTANSFSQRVIDSLEKVVATTTGTEKAKALILLSVKYGEKDTAKAFSLAKEAHDISLKSGYKKGVANYYFYRSKKLANQGNIDEAIAFLNKCFLYVDTLSPNSEWGSYYINLGGIYGNISQLDVASAAYLKALKMFDKINDTVGIARSCHGLGFVQLEAGNHLDAEKYYLKALKHYELAGLKREQASILSNLGALFLTKAMKGGGESDYRKSLNYLNRGVLIGQKINDYKNLSSCYNNLASLYGSKNELDVSLEYNFKSLDVNKKIDNPYGRANALGNIANAYLIMKRFDLAEKYCLEAIDIAEKANIISIVASNYGLLSDIKEAQKDFKGSLEYYRKSRNILDSLNTADKVKAMSEMEKKYDTEKKDKEIELLNQTQQASDAEIAKQKILNYSIGLGLALVVVFSFFLLRGYREKRKANDKLHSQNNIIEEKNRSITDSINYAKTIQSAIIPDVAEFSENFEDSFVLYMPKDIVSGDFYWISDFETKIFFAAVDCTGHGVPGGFMCMLGSSLLSEIVNEKKVSSPAEILNQLRDKIMFSLRQKGQSGESKDGMDISLCCLDKKTRKLTYSNAYNSFYVIRNNELIESEVNKMPVGYHFKMQPFKEFEIQLEKNDSLYLFTDGYADQFGGGKVGGKKFKYSRMKTLLLSLQEKSLLEQRNTLERTIVDWRGDLEQVDDICVIGIKI